MQPTDVLKGEHRIIEQVLSCLEKMADECLSEGKLDLPGARQALDFFQNFADRCHQAKEENALLPLMEARGIARQHGPLGRILHDHVLGRQYLHSLATAVEAASSGDREALQRFAEQCRSYVYWLREHILKEDDHLFPIANRALTEEDQRLLFWCFASTESHEMGARTHEKYVQMADALADRFNVPRAQTAHA